MVQELAGEKLLEEQRKLQEAMVNSASMGASTVLYCLGSPFSVNLSNIFFSSTSHSRYDRLVSLPYVLPVPFTFDTNAMPKVWREELHVQRGKTPLKLQTLLGTSMAPS